jgi:hypothetical protein
LLTFTSVYFSESGLFNELRPIQIKKIPSAISGCARRFEVNFGDVCFLLVGSLSTAGWDPATANGIARISLFAKIVRLIFCSPQFPSETALQARARSPEPQSRAREGREICVNLIFELPAGLVKGGSPAAKS